VRIVLNGKEGTPGFPGAMPPVALSFSDDQVAGVLTYIRNSWGLHVGAVTPELVAKVRRELADRQAPWTNAELQFVERERRRIPGPSMGPNGATKGLEAKVERLAPKR
jgi:hypothetical protein